VSPTRNNISQGTEMRVQGYDFNEPLSQNEVHEDGRLAPSIVNSDSCPADQFPTLDPEREPIQFDRVETLSAEHVARRLDVQSSKAAEKKVIIVESRIFLRECIQRSIQSALSIPVEMLSSFSELDDQRTIGSARLVIICLDETNTQESAKALSIIADLAPTLPTIVLSSKYDFEVMRAVIGCGAKGYILMTMGFEIAVEAVRFVLAGGTYVPAECLLSAIPSAGATTRTAASGAITSREFAVARAIHQGKSNKIIAYELNMCESTVKVHVRHIMKKLRAKNRTDVAIKATALLACSRCTNQSECWSAGRCSMKFA
jgi:DNA-binding NarL/FixJ family response regulator